MRRKKQDEGKKMGETGKEWEKNSQTVGVIGAYYHRLISFHLL